LLRAAGFDPSVQVPGVDEKAFPGESPEKMVIRLSIEKAKAINATDELIVAGDTIVAIDDIKLGKPDSPTRAMDMLSRLSGRVHRIVGGWCVRKGEEIYHGVEVCHVGFRRLAPSEIVEYVESGEPMDKAGGYGIQGAAGAFVSQFSGFRSTAIGLPLIPVTFSVEHLSRR